MPNFEQPSLKSEEYLGDIERVAYMELVESHLEVGAILKDIDRVVVHSQDKQEGEKYFLKVLGPRLEEAQKESLRALHDWLDSAAENLKNSEKIAAKNDPFEEPPITHFG